MRVRGKILALAAAGIAILIWHEAGNPAGDKIPLEHNEILGLNKLESLLWRRNPSLEVARLHIRSAKVHTRQKGLYFGPSFHSRYAYYPQSNTFEDAYTSSIHRGDLYMSYPLLDNVWRRKYEYRESKSMQEEIRAHTGKLWVDVLYRLRINYLTALEAAELAGGFEKTVKKLSYWVEALRIRIKAQEALPIELLELEKLILESDVSRLDQDKRRQQARNAIASLISLEAKSFLLPDTDSISWGKLPSAEELHQWACRRSSSAALFSARLMREKASTEAFPYRFFRLDLTAGYTVEEDRIGGFEFGSQFGLHLQIPISYQGLIDHRRMRRFLNEEALRKEIYANQMETGNKIASVYEDLNWLRKKKKVLEKDTQRLREIMRIAYLRRQIHTGEELTKSEDIYKTEYRLWLTEAEKIRLGYDGMRNLARLLYLAEIHNFDQMRKSMSKRPQGQNRKTGLRVGIAEWRN